MLFQVSKIYKGNTLFTLTNSYYSLPDRKAGRRDDEVDAHAQVRRQGHGRQRQRRQGEERKEEKIRAAR